VDDGRTFVIVPTFREKSKIEALLNCFSHVKAENVKILIVNGNPDDETSVCLEQCGDRRVLELSGNPGLYWSGLVNIGLRHVLHNETNQEFVIIMNADVEFEGDILTPLIAKGRSTANAQLAAVTFSDNTVVSSGVKVVSWFFTVNRHPLAGTLPDTLAPDVLIPVDFLPTRCTLIPFEAVKKAGLTAEKELPHYGGDNEYTNRVRKLGYPAYIFSGCRVKVDAKNTGIDVFLKKISFVERVGSIFSIKSTANPLYRLRFVKLVYPWYACPSARLLYAMRSVMEVLFGGGAIKFIVRRRESGFSGH
jgi:GT2 family glycosyltransferase